MAPDHLADDVCTCTLRLFHESGFIFRHYIIRLFNTCVICVNNILFKYKVHQDTTDTSYIQ